MKLKLKIFDKYYTTIEVFFKLKKTFFRNTFRQNLVSGEKHVIHPILFWLLNNIDELKKRAYLAKYLVKLDIPPEILGDADVTDIFDKVMF